MVSAIVSRARVLVADDDVLLREGVASHILGKLRPAETQDDRRVPAVLTVLDAH